MPIPPGYEHEVAAGRAASGRKDPFELFARHCVHCGGYTVFEGALEMSACGGCGEEAAPIAGRVVAFNRRSEPAEPRCSMCGGTEHEVTYQGMAGDQGGLDFCTSCNAPWKTGPSACAKCGSLMHKMIETMPPIEVCARCDAPWSPVPIASAAYRVPSVGDVAAYIVEWLQRRNRGELRGAFDDMRVADLRRMRNELELILASGGKPPNWP